MPTGGTATAGTRVWSPANNARPLAPPGSGRHHRGMPRVRALLQGLALFLLAAGLGAQAGPQTGGVSSIDTPTLKTWLTYIASDELQGRQVYSEGLGLAASYIADHLARWGVKPAGDDGSYFQTVRILGVRTDSRSTVAVTVNGETRTFADGDGFFLPRNMGGSQTLASSDVLFLGYGLHAPLEGHDDYAGFDPAGKVIVWLGAAGPEAAGARALAGRARTALERGAVAVIAPRTTGARRAASSGAAADRSPAAADFTTAGRLDQPRAPVVSAGPELLEHLFSGSAPGYAELAARAERREPLPGFPLEGVKVTITVAPEYSVVTTRLSRNVVGIVEGTDPRLKGTYVSIGAHYDHIGYHQTLETPTGGAPFGCPGQTRREVRPGDIVNNGADDDGSGTVALMAIARAFALGPKPRRSLLFIWHTAEESGLQGSQYNADHPVVPNEDVIAHLNMDMVGRNRCDDPAQANTVYLVGSDRISTDLHNLSEETNAALREPLTLDYELNDPADPQSLYTRSDHYSYAAKGIPVIFYTTGLHRDYHFVTDEIERIEFEKMTRVARLVFLTGERLANLEHRPVRDNKGPRVGVGRGGMLDR